MEEIKLGSRSIVFRYDLGDWYLNIQLIQGDKYNYLIDTGLGSESIDPIRKYFENSSKPLIVINTHFHWDHVWGNHCFQKEIMIAHELCYDLIEENWQKMLTERKEYMQGTVEKKLPNLLIQESIYFPEDGIYIFHAPGHTNDSLCVYDEKDKILNAADNVDDEDPVLEMDLSSYEKFRERYQNLEIEACVSGHNKILGNEVFHKMEELRKKI